MKKKFFLITITIICCLLIFNYLKKDQRTNITNQAIDNFVVQNDYQIAYPISDYVDEELNSNEFFRHQMIRSILSFDELQGIDGLGHQIIFLLKGTFSAPDNYGIMIQDHQYDESIIVEINAITGQEDHNYEYCGTLNNQQKVTGNLAIFESSEGYSVAVSFQDENGNIDPNKSKLLIDDSNAEMLAYLIVEETQSIYGTNMEPDSASEYYYSTTIEELAGSISYHAAASLVVYSFGESEIVFDKVKTANISTEDPDGFLINRNY